MPFPVKRFRSRVFYVTGISVWSEAALLFRQVWQAILWAEGGLDKPSTCLTGLVFSLFPISCCLCDGFAPPWTWSLPTCPSSCIKPSLHSCHVNVHLSERASAPVCLASFCLYFWTLYCFLGSYFGFVYLCWPKLIWPLPVSSLHKLVPNVITLYLCPAPKPLLPPVSGTGLDSHSTAELLLRGLLLVLTDLNIFSAILYALEPNIQCLPTSCMKIHTLAQIQSEIPVTLRNRLQVVRGGLLSGSSQAWYDRCQCYLHFCRDSLIISISSGSHHGSQLPQ